MKDRVPTYPGRVTLTPVSGQANTYDMVRADQPTQDGTPLSKENLLSDATASALGLTGDPTVDDAFGRLAKSEYKIGDIRVTVRDDLTDEWLLCNGETVDVDYYPSLKPYLINTFTSDGAGNSAYVKFSFASSAPVRVVGVAYGNGKYVYALNGQGSQRAQVLVCDDLPTVNSVLVQTSPEGATGSAYCIIYANGTFVVGGARGDYPAIRYCTGDPAVSGNWTEKVISSQKGCVRSLAWENGTFVVGGATAYGTDWSADSLTYGRPTIWFGDSPSVSLTENVIANLGSASATSIKYRNGLWVTATSDSINNSGGTSYQPAIFYSSNLSGTWSQAAVPYTGNAYGTYLVDVEYGGGMWVACGWTNQGTFGPRVWYSTDISGPWTTKNIIPASSIDYASTIAYIDGLWIVGLYSATAQLPIRSSYVYYTADITGDWNNRTVGNYMSVKSVSALNGELVFTGWYGLRDMSDSTYNQGEVANFSLSQLPAVSIDGAYAYIKAKEATT